MRRVPGSRVWIDTLIICCPNPECEEAALSPSGTERWLVVDAQRVEAAGEVLTCRACGERFAVRLPVRLEVS